MHSEIKTIFKTKQIYLIDFQIMVISDYYRNLESATERSEFRAVVLDRTGMSYSTFYAKLQSDNFTPAEREVINNIMKEWENA